MWHFGGKRANPADLTQSRSQPRGSIHEGLACSQPSSCPAIGEELAEIRIEALHGINGDFFSLKLYRIAMFIRCC